ncbi:hypothetical protein AVEN_108706-1 [Araneus ventricosus]|uniref:Uncharacterized protein n=1 Tax=Araneus ventricosus TaxID=182803 RepID=A0A4Y2R751_ARAVE|nr:hypothetical protein AVEN_108706-1 [Araneus ventricosus]
MERRTYSASRSLASSGNFFMDVTYKRVGSFYRCCLQETEFFLHRKSVRWTHLSPVVRILCLQETDFLSRKRQVDCIQSSSLINLCCFKD